ncbi:hypothetical protein A3860_11215 [Niastella vici]|uniref:Iron dicitrate transport regulator FecR n=1 Tax=Niastella vici TaxID=1703345 RepID=A0A1V9FFJ0_9BACT|nr:FecR family protein [Niastella vici]OQP57125.1 hypothetical protein A3860_11215 [Niastella vici]
MSSNNEPILGVLYKIHQQQPLTPEEEALLNNWLRETADAAGILEQLKEDKELVAYLKGRLDQENEQRALERFRSMAFSHTGNAEVEAATPAIQKHPRSRYLVWGWAAAILVIAVASVALWKMGKPVHKTDAPVLTNNQQQDALPGSDRAILTLASGEKVLLDSSHRNIIQQKDFNVTNRDNQLDYTGSSSVVEEHTLSTPRGGQYKLLLPDGTTVWLNAASSITYPTAFTGDSRKVKITGELYFEVAKDSKRPFHVMANGMEVQVLGTHFNINAYDDEKDIKTTLLEGSVKVTRDAASVILRPGEQTSVSHKSKPSQPISVQTEEVMAWKNGTFFFNRTPFSEVMRQLSRWYDVDVIYEKEIPTINFGGEMKRDLNLSQVLEGFDKMGVQFRIEGKKLIIAP